MTVLARREADVSWRARLRRFFEDILPWYDAQAERERAARWATFEAQASKAIEVASRERIRAAYEAGAERLERQVR